MASRSSKSQKLRIIEKSEADQHPDTRRLIGKYALNSSEKPGAYVILGINGSPGYHLFHIDDIHKFDTMCEKYPTIFTEERRNKMIGFLGNVNLISQLIVVFDKKDDEHVAYVGWIHTVSSFSNIKTVSSDIRSSSSGASSSGTSATSSSSSTVNTSSSSGTSTTSSSSTAHTSSGSSISSSSSGSKDRWRCPSCFYNTPMDKFACDNCHRLNPSAGDKDGEGRGDNKEMKVQVSSRKTVVTIVQFNSNLQCSNQECGNVALTSHCSKCHICYYCNHECQSADSCKKHITLCDALGVYYRRTLDVMKPHDNFIQRCKMWLERMNRSSANIVDLFQRRIMWLEISIPFCDSNTESGSILFQQNVNDARIRLVYASEMKSEDEKIAKCFAFDQNIPFSPCLQKSRKKPWWNLAWNDLIRRRKITKSYFPCILIIRVCGTIPVSSLPIIPAVLSNYDAFGRSIGFFVYLS